MEVLGLSTADQPGRKDDRRNVDATRRSYLAAERTLLAWWRSGLASLAVALAVGRLVPAIIHAPTLPFITLGVGFGILAVAFIVYGTSRQRRVERALEEGRFSPLDGWVVTSMTALMVVLAIATVSLIAFERQ